jgi:hypothetical protein
VNQLGGIGSKDVCEPASNSNLNELYSNSKLKDTSIQKHNAGSMIATINYIEKKF